VVGGNRWRLCNRFQVLMLAGWRRQVVVDWHSGTIATPMVVAVTPPASNGTRWAANNASEIAFLLNCFVLFVSSIMVLISRTRGLLVAYVICFVFPHKLLFSSFLWLVRVGVGQSGVSAPTLDRPGVQRGENHQIRYIHRSVHVLRTTANN
jgi:hypothetical protein